MTAARVSRSLAALNASRLQLQASAFHHPLLPPILIDPRVGLNPDSAAVLAILLNPDLRSVRDQRGAAEAQLLQAGILPNPQLTASTDFVTGGNTTDTYTGYGLGLNWEVTSLITRHAKIAAARAQRASVDLDIAWQEWQIAMGARTAVYDLLGLQAQLVLARSIDARLSDNVRLLQGAVDKHLKSVVDLAAADATARDAHATVLSLEQQEAHQRLVLLKAIGLAANTPIVLQSGIALPDSIALPPLNELEESLDTRRLDLLALKLGYESQEQTLRAAVLSQFPKVTLGFNLASDTSNVHTLGPGVAIDLPIFDRAQGTIAVESATRQKLYDEYITRLNTAHFDLAMALSDIKTITAQIADLRTAIPVLQRLVDVYKQAYDRGNVDVLSYYTAVLGLQQQSLAVLKLQQQLADTKVALELASGRYIPASTAPPASLPTTIPSAKEANP